MEFRILGPLELSDENGVVDLAGSKQRALLAVLLLHVNSVVSSDRLIDDLWGQEPPASGVTALQVRVSQLRKALGKAATLVETRAPGYVLRLGPTTRLDLHRFEQLVTDATAAEPAQAAETLRDALSLWRGPSLAEFAYDAFAQAAIGRLEELQLTAIEMRIEADLAFGRAWRAGRRAGVARPRKSATRAPPWPADAGALSGRPPGRGARGLPVDPSDARRRSGDRAVASPARAREDYLATGSGR